MAQAVRNVSLFSETSNERRNACAYIRRIVAGFERYGVIVLMPDLKGILTGDFREEDPPVSLFVRLNTCNKALLRRYLLNTGRLAGWDPSIREALAARYRRYPKAKAIRLAA